jgi:hypothetical protein
MQFKHPEILYALLFLIIPIIVHLFQLQRFTKVAFTNVQFLKKIEKQTRKSSQLKKWLILITRSLIFASLIFAFSQPYFSKYETHQNFHTTIYLDNSFSMQAKGENGELLKSITQQIIEKSNEQNTPISILTNDNFFKNLNAQNLKNELISIEYDPNKLDLNSVLVQLNNKNLSKINTLNKNIIISDFQYINFKNNPNFTNVNSEISLLKLTPNSKNNIYVDSVFIATENVSEITLNVIIKCNNDSNKSVPVSLFEDKKLIGKTTATFNNSTSKTIQFTIPNTTDFNGKISLADDVLAFDNDFFFTISKPVKINVLSIGKTSEFLPKIYSENEFIFTTSPLRNLNYNTFENQQLIILNELENIPKELQQSILKFSNNGGDIVIIPSEKSDINSYNQFFKTLNLGKIDTTLESEQKVISINYEHPLIEDVFEKRITNFQYPTTNLVYKSQLTNSTPILTLNNSQPFVSSFEANNQFIYWISSPLTNKITDFTQSSLIVPIFYNFAKHSLKLSQLYYTIQPELTLDVKATVRKDNVLKISNATSEFIPLQHISQNKVSIQLQNQILTSGFYTILSKNERIQTIAFNYDRAESNLTYADLKPLIEDTENVTIANSIDSIFKEINNEQKINWLFKWFLAFSILFLCIEMLILKYFKI